MKVLFFAFFLIAGAFARSAVLKQKVSAEGPECPIEDPLARDGPLPINVTLHPIVNVDLESAVTSLIAEGLSTLNYTVDISILLVATFEVKLDRVTGNATYIASGYIDARPIRHETIPSGNFTGSGFGKVSATGVHLKGRANLYVNIIGNKVQMSNLNLEIVKFDSLEIDLGTTFTIGGSPVDWAELSATVKENFDQDFLQHKNALQDKIRGAANRIIGQYTLAELIELIGGGGGGGEC